jgi:endonuclease/exonuclease/phosphatase family metal-dependent hydrolase
MKWIFLAYQFIKHKEVGMRFHFFFLFMLSVLIMFSGCKKDPVNTLAPNMQEENEALLCKRFLPQGITVMTRNVYVGTDVDRVLIAEDPTQIPIIVAEIFQMAQSTHFPARAEALANEVAAAQPHLIGLQEVSIIRHQSPGDALVGGTIPAETVLYDYLKILMGALKAKGLNYQVAGIIQDTDVEMPMYVGGDPYDPMSYNDMRLTDFDVVLARSDVEVINTRAANYKVRLEVPSAGISVLRGYIIADVRINKRKYCFVNTHLEPAPIPELLPIQLAQAQELVKKIHQWGKPIILVGDFNAPAPDSPTYQFLLSQGYVDAWEASNPTDNGFTYGHDLWLMNEMANFYERIDFIFVRNKRNCGGIGLVTAEVVGDEPENRTPEGLWPSDHGGVVAQLDLPRKAKYVALD